MTEDRVLRENEESWKRAMRLSLYVLIVFFLLLMRLWYLQIIKAEDFRYLSENNRLRTVPVAAARGAILDRNGKLLVGNQPSFSVAVIRQEVKDRDVLLSRLARYLDLDMAELQEKWNKSRGAAKYYPFIVASGISRDQLEFLEENRLRLPGVDVEMKPVREYADGGLALHLLGYLGQITDDELERDDFDGYNAGDYIGKGGVERAFERDLHGRDGGRELEVDARGRILRTVSESLPAVGKSLMLTIDLDVQKKAEEALGSQAGAAVALDVNTGEVLAFASTPAFDPEDFSGRMSREKWQAYLDDKRHPLENKALKGQYPPGSTFKIITALAGLEEGLIDEHTTVHCKGSYQLGNHVFKCWEKHGHGDVNLKKALKQSCDVYFYQLAERLGVDKIAVYAKKFHLGEPLGIGLQGEKGGMIPTAAWKEKKFGQKWMRGETLPVGIGQGYVLATPIQLASMIATVANGGTIYRPFLVKKVLDQDGKVLREYRPQVIGNAGIKPMSLKLVDEGLQAVVNEAGGTGGAARLYEVQVAGKTGTSQVVKLHKGPSSYEHRDHALFVAFAPVEKPEIAVAVVVEHGEHGGGSAAPVAGRMLRAYFEGRGVIKKPQAAKDETKEDEGEDGEGEVTE
jgi:penicillin-binding protein 2